MDTHAACGTTAHGGLNNVAQTRMRVRTRDVIALADLEDRLVCWRTDGSLMYAPRPIEPIERWPLDSIGCVPIPAMPQQEVEHARTALREGTVSASGSGTSSSVPGAGRME